MSRVTVKRRSGSAKTTIRLGGSKSIVNRLLIIKSLADSEAEIANIGFADDSQLLKNHLQIIDTCASSRIPLIIDAKNAGTVFRFLASYLSQKEGRWLLTGSERMKERPTGILVDALKSLGARIDYAESPNFPPLVIKGGNIKGGKLKVDASVSSQFISSLMMLGPNLKGGLKLELEGEKVSFPYVTLTAEIMKICGIDVQIENNKLSIPESDYDVPDWVVEPDWSSASYWYEFAALADDANIFLEGFRKDSLQGDRILADIFVNFGVHTEFLDKGISLTKTAQPKKDIELNLIGQPDLVPAILATGAALGVNITITGIEHLEFKESNRIESLTSELIKTGVRLRYSSGRIKLLPGAIEQSARLVFDSHDDHRITMCLAPLALRFDSVVINDPQVVEKSYPEFWSDLENSGSFTVNKF